MVLVQTIVYINDYFFPLLENVQALLLVILFYNSPFIYNTWKMLFVSNHLSFNVLSRRRDPESNNTGVIVQKLSLTTNQYR